MVSDKLGIDRYVRIFDPKEEMSAPPSRALPLQWLPDHDNFDGLRAEQDDLDEFLAAEQGDELDKILAADQGDELDTIIAEQRIDEDQRCGPAGGGELFGLSRPACGGLSQGKFIDYMFHGLYIISPPFWP